jgi:predicted lipoprotein with Yx(FWY)xxD motif
LIPRAALGVGVAAFALLTVVRLYAPPRPATPAGSTLPSLTPPGITLQARVGTARQAIAAAADVVYADAHGMTLYAHDVGAQPHADACSAECLRTWPPAIAPPAATAAGEWSLLRLGDGTRQWLYRGAPLHRFSGDASIGDTRGDARDPAWHVAVMRPGAGMRLPAGIAVREIDDAGGIALVDFRGMTLYIAAAVAGGAPCAAEPDCARHWPPLAAPAIANAVGEFAAVSSADGVTQWTFRGQPLFRHDGDRQPGDVNGAGAQFRAALIARLFMPAEAAIHRNPELGAILTTRDGATLYQRDRVTAGEERHEFRSDHGAPALGRAWGTASCDTRCTKTWPPLTAPDGALSSGYWDVLKRADGTRQWAYKGFALYRYAADQPGDIGGNQVYSLAHIGTGPATPLPAGGRIDDSEPGIPLVADAPGLGLGAMFWHAVVP